MFLLLLLFVFIETYSILFDTGSQVENNIKKIEIEKITIASKGVRITCGSSVDMGIPLSVAE